MHNYCALSLVMHSEQPIVHPHSNAVQHMHDSRRIGKSKMSTAGCFRLKRCAVRACVHVVGTFKAVTITYTRLAESINVI